MQRDWNIIRIILQRLEDKGAYGDAIRPESVEGYDIEIVSYHIQMLDQAGIIVAKCQERHNRNRGIFCLAMNLTWEGHELLDSIKSDTVWNKMRNLFREKSIALSYEAVKVAAFHITKNSLLS